MDVIKPGYEVLYIWNDKDITEIEQQVTELKKIASVKLENSERLQDGENCEFPLEFSQLLSLLL